VRILLVEDDRAIADFIIAGLSEQGHAIDHAVTGPDGLDWVAVVEFDLYILDVMLPGMDGFALCREIRRRGIRAPILMLTARDSVDDRVQGLDSGADDYLVKPFAFAELVARVRALGRREPGLAATVLRVGDLELDTSTRIARRGEVEIPLTTREFSLLEYLMRNPNQVLTRAMIGERIWNFDFDNTSNVIDVLIRYLRKKVDDPFEPRLIQTVRGAGYRISAGETP
jgi:DNA-binding response OmpR family regulator